MAILQKDLTALKKDFKALENKMEKLLKALDTGSKPKKVSKPKVAKKATAKKVTAKKATAKKATAKKVTAKKVTAKKTTAKKATAKKVTAKKTTAKKAAVKKAPAKAKAVKKAPAKKAPAQKKVLPVTATDQILKIIKRSKKGVDVPTLKTKTGFDDKKVRNVVFRAAKEGRIKKSGRGIYVGG